MPSKSIAEVKTSLTHRERVRVLSFAIDAVRDMHGRVTGEGEHAAEASRCKCQYGDTLKALKDMRREHFAAIQGAKMRREAKCQTK